MNRTAFDYIRAHELYNLDGQLRMVAAAAPVNFPPAPPRSRRTGAPSADDERTRYHTLEVRFADGTAAALRTDRPAHRRQRPAPMVLGNLRARGQSNSSGRGRLAIPLQRSFRLPRGDRGLQSRAHRYRSGGNRLAKLSAARHPDPLRRTAKRPLLLANSELEAGMQRSSSCITCHARSSLALVGGAPTRLPIFDTAVFDPDGRRADSATERRGYIGLPLARVV